MAKHAATYYEVQKTQTAKFLKKTPTKSKTTSILEIKQILLYLTTEFHFHEEV